jgi:uncharacterized protein (TIGR03437 family)
MRFSRIVLAQFVVTVVVAAQTFTVTPSSLTINGAADSASVPQPITFQISSPTAGTQFTFGPSYIILNPGPPVQAVGINAVDLLISPSSGTTPATISVTLTPNLVRILYPGMNSLVMNIFGLQIPITVNLSPPPPPVVRAIVDAASFQPRVSAGSLISIFGDNIGPLPTVATLGRYGPYLAFIDPILANLVNVAELNTVFNNVPQLYASTTQVNAVLPPQIAGLPSVTVVLEHDGVKSRPVTLILSDTSPSIFTANQTGTGQGAILNQDGSQNSAANPAPPESVVQIFANGAGQWNPILPAGVLVPLAPPYPMPVNQVSATIGGAPAQVQYAGAAPNLVFGMLQVNAVVPAGLAPGPQQIVLKIGQNDNAQQGVTVAVR